MITCTEDSIQYSESLVPILANAKLHKGLMLLARDTWRQKCNQV